MKVTIKNEMTWVGIGRDFANRSKKSIERTLKEMTGADDCEITEIINEEEDDDE